MAILLVAGLFGGRAALAADAGDTLSVTPYRPSVSTPAALSAPGWLEVEVGGLRARGNEDSRQDSLPYTLKLAFSDDWGVRLGGDAWVRQRDDAGNKLSGVGGMNLVVKRRFGVGESTAFGLEAGATIPTAKSGLGSGKSDYSINGIFSADLGSYHTDLNLIATRMGQIEPDVRRTQWLWAASVSRALAAGWGVVGELSGTQQGGVDSTGQWLVAASYNVSPAVTLDAGVSRSLRSAGPRWSAFAGLTFLAFRLF